MRRKILYLAANPDDTERLGLEKEARAIKEGLQLAKHRDQFEIVTEWAVRPRDLRRALINHQPQIVHFSGHGAGKKGLVLIDDADLKKPVSTRALANLFKLFEDEIECVVLNACYSEVQAEAIHQHIDYVVGMDKEIGDEAAIEFAVGFYDALGSGYSYEKAYNFGCAAIDLESIPEHTTPVLKNRSKSVQLSAVPLEESPKPSSNLLAHPLPNLPKDARVFISYKRGFEPDEPVALEVYKALSQHLKVFIDQTMVVGTKWAERIETEIRQSDYLITFLSEQSVHSEMVRGEVETAHHLAKEQGGKPVILPVRLAYREPFAYPLSAYLNKINWAFWETPADTPRLVNELMQAIAGKDLPVRSDQAKAELVVPSEVADSVPQPLASAQPVSLELPEGTMDPKSGFYAERPGDEIALETIQLQGVTITIKGPRQMGKSSLLIRTTAKAAELGKRVAYLDFQLFDGSVLKDGDRFYRQFCEWLTEELELENKVTDYWNSQMGNNQRCTRYMSRHLLKELNEPLVLAMDEVETVFDTDFRSDFFGMLRNWHNSRATTPIWKQLDLVLVTSTEPYQLIENLNQSPFNVGQTIELVDFDAKQIADLNQRHGLPLSLLHEQRLMELLNGHPYLVRRALYLVASHQMTADDLFAQATADRGPFGDHLRYHLFRMSDKPELVQGLLQTIQHQRCQDERVFFRLRGAGLVRREGQKVLPRCQLYADYFREHLHG